MNTPADPVLPALPPPEDLTGVRASRMGLYVHFPWCRQRCPYCDFAVTVAPRIPHAAYFEALVAELDLRLAHWPSLKGRTLESVFIGGGTPSLWEPAFAGRLLEAIDQRMPLAAGAELALEANPGPEDAAAFPELQRAGFNRLSLGVQSFSSTTLTSLGRSHTAAEAEHAVAAAQDAGFTSVSLDLIYGVQGQRLEDVKADVARAVSLGTTHASAYALTLEREALAVEVPLGKQLARGEISLPPDEVVVDMAHAIEDGFGAAGLTRYEISNFAKPGFHSRHNTLYWTGGEYLALGAGATGFLANASLPSEERTGDGAPRPTGVSGGLRYENLRSAPRYLAQVGKGELPESGREQLGAEERFAE
ncbi:MAG TPA: radical SAM family heme chaperone HemW, partial [Myxococcaceae bacterium]|nr:radical SAM family heme chaperone HemW [Myxococcaceae bacterium]